MRLGDFGECSALDFGERDLGDALIGVLGDIRGDLGDRGDLLSNFAAVHGNANMVTQSQKLVYHWASGEFSAKI